jgi:hypothetical protein
MTYKEYIAKTRALKDQLETLRIEYYGQLNRKPRLRVPTDAEIKDRLRQVGIHRVDVPGYSTTEIQSKLNSGWSSYVSSRKLSDFFSAMGFIKRRNVKGYYFKIE